jgi:ribosomal protein S18
MSNQQSETTENNIVPTQVAISNLQKYPLDCSQLKKGASIPASYLEKMIGFTVDQPEYRFESMLLAKRVETFFAVKGEPLTCRIIRGDLVCLTDEQALEYREFKETKIITRYIKNHARTSEIDRNQLSQSSQFNLDKAIRRQALGILALTGKQNS